MRKCCIIFLSALALFAREHIVKVQPSEIYHIKSAAAGEVVFSDIDKEGRILRNEVPVRIDDLVERKNLLASQRKLQNLISILKINQEALKNDRSIVQIKKDDYERIKDLKTKSRFEKERRRAEFLNANNLYLARKEKIASLRNQIEDLRFAIAKLKDTIAKKNPKISGYLYKIYVKKGDFVNFGSPLMDVADTTKAKVELFLDANELKDIEHKAIYIDGKKTPYKLSEIEKIADTKHISEYKVKFYMKSPKYFSQLIKVEIK